MDRSERRIVLACWLACAGAGLAWAGQLVAGYFLEEAACSPGSRHWGLDAKALEGIVSLAALLGALAALGTGRWLTRAAAAGDPRGRVAFLGFWGIAGGLFFVALIVVTGIGILALSHCTIG